MADENSMTASPQRTGSHQAEICLRFEAVDSWFFRESRPHDAAGASELGSLFPPPVRTLAGALRYFLGETMGFDWHSLKDDEQKDSEAVQEFKRLLGDAEKLAPLSLKGGWVCKDGRRLYPAPCYLMHRDGERLRLEIGEVVECDLGRVRLPQLPKDKKGFKAYEQCWITAAGWQSLLDGDVPQADEIFAAKELFTDEPRLGIARNNQTRSVEEGRLYQTRHLRLQHGVSVELDVAGIDQDLQKKLPTEQEALLRLGGEGRMAAFSLNPVIPELPKLGNDAELETFIIHFITAADFAGKLYPEGFEKKTENGREVWRGKLDGIEFDIESAVIGKVHREGGWDMQKHQPRTVKSYIPAGSAWFCRARGDSGKNILRLHEKCIGLENEWGRGQILIGQWTDNDTTQGAENGDK